MGLDFELWRNPGDLGILPSNIILWFVFSFLILNKDMQHAKAWITLQTHFFFGISERKEKNPKTSYSQGEEKSFVLSQGINARKFLTTEPFE